ncbi:related to tRNA (adenine-N(1)-)-methyltransferase [Rhynchosporium agropyri]|uniref:tRNA (adenine(58)-N(1))-methyltransferase catalytic subunit TRM61 n=1 Tax=Rhynchosporium agropyri TaxID=914238 RepID=A0A1E1JW96_9HELO|nr:related to tRNA (adenine-N(1)-)-methyltransferase [Rhynchosporium agropyri]
MPVLQYLCPSTSRILSRTGGLPVSLYSWSSRSYSKRVVKENDIVLLKHRVNPSPPIITGKLRPGGKTVISAHNKGRDHVANDDIIGRELRDIVTSKRGTSFRILEPTLAEHTDNSPRIVTPIYSQDASLIVSLLDLHPTPPRPNDPEDTRLEIFEAGTGQGALTLHLSRAIHAANPPVPIITAYSPAENNNGQVEEDLKNERDWRAARRAVIHTLDIHPAHSAHAETVVKNFRNGLYFPNIDFHTGTIQDYLSERLETSVEPFLDHAILDLPSTQSHFEIVCKTMKLHGMLLAFCPSITQINACVLLCKKKNLPLFLEKVIEIGGTIGVGGREWDVRLVTPRASKKVIKETEDVNVPGDEVVKDRSDSDAMSIGGNESSEQIGDTSSVDSLMVCRPKVGTKVSGGGFVGVWRKITPFSENGVH